MLRMAEGVAIPAGNRRGYDKASGFSLSGVVGGVEQIQGRR